MMIVNKNNIVRQVSEIIGLSDRFTYIPEEVFFYLLA